MKSAASVARDRYQTVPLRTGISSTGLIVVLENDLTQAAAAGSETQKLLGFSPKLVPQLQATELLHFRRLVKRPPLSPSDRSVLETELQAMAEWRVEEEARAKEMHVTDPRSAEEKAAELEVQRQLLQAFIPPCTPHEKVDWIAFLIARLTKCSFPLWSSPLKADLLAAHCS